MNDDRIMELTKRLAAAEERLALASGKLKATTMMIDPETRRRALLIGRGRLGKGFRLAVLAYPIDKENPHD